jgi:hypothetical protein
MINQIRSDFASNPRAAVVLAAIVVLGIACWFPALAARGMPGSAHHQRTSISVLSDPFANDHK